MDSQEALKFVNQLLIKQNLKAMNTLETHIFKAAWQGRNGQNNRQIAKELGYQESSVRDAGHNLWRRLAQVCHQRVMRGNLRAVVEQLQRTVVEQLQRDDVATSLPNFVKAPIAPQDPVVTQQPSENNTQPPQSISALGDQFNLVLEKLGIRGGTLGIEEFIEPTECITKVTERLYFMGILGSKWVREGNPRNKFEEFLKTMENNRRKVRFLLIQPGTQAFNQFQQGRGDDSQIRTDSLDHFRILIQRFNCLEVRLYNFLPCFRMIFINKNNPVLAFSQYSRDRAGYIKSSQGWQVPHLVIEPYGEWSLFFAFEQYYNQVWDSSMSLEQYFELMEHYNNKYRNSSMSLEQYFELMKDYHNKARILSMSLEEYFEFNKKGWL